MDEEKLVKLLEEKFVTKDEFKKFENNNQKSFYDMGVQLKSIETELKEMREEIGEIKPSIKPLDKILENYPIERITRLEKHSKLPKFVPAGLAEE